MAESEYDTMLDELERASLQKLISEVETALAVSTPGTRSHLEIFLVNAKGRVGALDKKIKDSQTGRENQAREQAAIFNLAQKETALSAREQETYSGFLQKDFFTKKDFGSLEQFYEKTWDRLSEGGKDQMSHRIWEGIRHDEYKFSELPQSVREKEAEYAYKRLSNSSIEVGNVGRIPEQDRRDFIRAYESGDHEDASKILDRNSFRENMFRGQGSAAHAHSAVGLGREIEKANAAAKLEIPAVKEESQKAPTAAKGADRDLTALDLAGVKLVDADSQGTSAEIPSGKTAGPAQRQSTRGG